MVLIRGWFIFIIALIQQVDDVLFPTIWCREFDEQIESVKHRFIGHMLVVQLPINLFHCTASIEIES